MNMFTSTGSSLQYGTVRTVQTRQL
jgi:hypothetical protein